MLKTESEQVELDAYEIAYYAVRGTNDLEDVEKVEKQIKALCERTSKSAGEGSPLEGTVIGLMVKTEDGIGKVISQPYTDALEIDVDGATGLYNIQDLKAL